jgi:hypothetical protein
MPHVRKRRRTRCGGALALGLLTLALGPATTQAAGPPIISETWASQVFSTSTRLHARINPNGIFTTYRFDYLTKAAYDANVSAGKDPFLGASRVPAVSDAPLGSGTNPLNVSQQPFGLSPNTAYRYRVVAKNSTTTTGDPFTFVTQSSGGGPVLADGRGWEMVSPVDKNGGRVAGPGELFGGGVLQAAAQGSAVTYGSEASFAGGAGAPPASQYLATRVAGGWSTQNLTAPIFSGTYDASDGGVPYQLFSGDLVRALLLNGDHCRGEDTDCAVANPPLAGTSAPAGYQNYYLREGGSFTALLGAANAGFLTLEPKAFDLRFAGASADLRYGVISTCAALTANATEVPEGEGCDPGEQNLYLYSPGGGTLTLLNLLPAQGTGTPGAALTAQSGAVSPDGIRVYFTLEGNLYLRAAGQTKPVDDEAGGGGSFETASADGSVAYFTKAQHLWRYVVATDTATDITPSGGVVGVLGTSASGAIAYFQDAAGLKRWQSGTTATVAPGADAALPSNYPPTTGASRVSADGTKLLFLSALSLTGYDNKDLNSGEPDSEVFLYDSSGAGTLICVSCNPTLARPIGPSTIPGAAPNGTAAGSTSSYKPRSLSANGKRVFFDSEDALVLSDTNDAHDAYQWQAQGEGSCMKAGGCISLVSDGKAARGATFIDASADGADAFFTTEASLVKSDPGAMDLYDARVGGGFPIPPPPIVCEGDACQPLPSPPVDPTLTTLLKGPGNPGVRYPKERCPRGKVRRKGRCVLKGKRAGKGKRGAKRSRGGQRRSG